MGVRYAVLYGPHGVKGFNKLKNANRFARKLADRSLQTVEVDKITTYPRAKAGQVDFSQRHHKYVHPKAKFVGFRKKVGG